MNHARSRSDLSTRRLSSGVNAPSTGDEGRTGVKTAVSTDGGVEAPPERMPAGVLKDSRCSPSRIASLPASAMS
eukprot:10873821-Heterocapsa_arctica.AAC.1